VDAGEIGAVSGPVRSLGSVRRSFAPWADPKAEPLVRFERVTKRFGDFLAVDDLSLALYPRELFALLGPSGCGKSTLMRMLAGFEAPDAGRILLDGEDLSGVPPHRRPVNMMFQSYALFPHMSVWDNVAFGLKQEGLPRAEIARRVEEMLAVVKLEGLARRPPDQLSGGQRQRVALARSLAKRPKVLLLDEPLAALDRKLREATQFELMDIQVELGTTFMVVTHDQDEAMTMADRMAVMDRGRIVQIGPPEVVYERPASRFVAEFVGDVTIFEGVVERVEGEHVRVAVPGVGVVELDDNAPTVRAGDRASVAIRPEKISVSHDEPAEPANKVAGEVWDIGYLGDVTMLQVRLDDGKLVKVGLANRTRRVARPIAWEDRVWLSWDVEAGVLIDG
jgi:putrescine transport system ATP-binding protein